MGSRTTRLLRFIEWGGVLLAVLCCAARLAAGHTCSRMLTNVTHSVYHVHPLREHTAVAAVLAIRTKNVQLLPEATVGQREPASLHPCGQGLVTVGHPAMVAAAQSEAMAQMHRTCLSSIVSRQRTDVNKSC